MIQPEDMNNNMYEEEQSYDDVTEPTPEPTNIRPPPPTAQPADLKPSDDSEDDGGNHNNMNEVTQNRSIMNQSLFSFSVDASMTNDGYIDGPISEATSLPSLPMEPPSPISRPSESLFSESASSTRRPHNKVPSNKPMSEVRVINENSEGTEASDDFYECLDDQSLALRAKHSLETKTPSPKKQDVRQEKQLQTTSSKPPRTTSGTTTQDRNSKSYNTPATTSTARRTFLHSSTPLSRSITPSSSPLQNPKSRLVADPQQPSSDDVARVHNDALQALLKMKEELMRANDRNQALQNEKEELEADRDSLQQRLFDAQESVQDQIEETNRNWETRHKRLVEEKEASWRAQRNKLEDEKRAALKQQKDSMKIKLASDNRQRELKTQLSSLREELESALASKEELKSDVGLLQEKKTQLVAENTSLIEQVEALRSSQSPSNEVVETLNSELNAKDEEIASLTAKLEDQKANFEEEISKLQSEVQSAKQTLHDERETNQKELSRLKKGLQTANDTLRSTSVLRPTPSSRGGKTPSSKTPSSFHTNSVRFQQEGFSFDTAASSPREGATLETSIADRLARMRDSAERAHLIRGHKKELARVKTDKEKAIQNLQAAHEEELQLTKKQATAQTNKEVAEVKKSLQEEHVTALEAVEAKHKKTLAELKQEFENNQEAADDNLRSALSKLATASQNSERESASRKSLERSIEQLRTQHDYDKRQLQARYTQDIDNRRHEWNEERETLLAMIQKDCNSAIERHRYSKKSTAVTQKNGLPTGKPPSSPFRATRLKSTTPISKINEDDFYLTVETALSGSAGGGSSSSEASQLESPSPRSRSNRVSPVYSDIDTVLRETEDLIESIG